MGMAAPKLLQARYHNPLTELHGALRVGKTRVTLDAVIYSFQDGASAEEIVAAYPSLALSDVYAAIALYLDHQEEVDAYIGLREKDRDAIREQNSKLFSASGLRERLLRRQAEFSREQSE